MHNIKSRDHSYFSITEIILKFLLMLELDFIFIFSAFMLISIKVLVFMFCVFVIFISSCRFKMSIFYSFYLSFIFRYFRRSTSSQTK